MKEWKEEIVSRIAERAQGERIVPLKDVAAEMGLRHISRQDTADIQRAALQRLPDYRAVRMERTPHDSLFQSLCFVERCVEFSEG